MKKLLLFVSLLVLAACDGGGSDSGGMVEATLPGTDVPASFAGTYTGTVTLTASAAGVSETDSFPITITVTNDAMVRFESDDADESFTVGLANSGMFAGNLPFNEDPCEGNIAVTGSVDGTTAEGTVSGDATCRINGLDIDAEVSGDFSATR